MSEGSCNKEQLLEGGLVEKRLRTTDLKLHKKIKAKPLPYMGMTPQYRFHHSCRCTRKPGPSSHPGTRDRLLWCCSQSSFVHSKTPSFLFSWNAALQANQSASNNIRFIFVRRLKTCSNQTESPRRSKLSIKHVHPPTVSSSNRFYPPRSLYSIGSQSAPYGAPVLRERNLGAPRAIRLLIKILKEIYCGAP